MMKCPECKEVIGSPSFREITVGGVGRTAVATICYTCPKCKTILSIEADPIVTERRLQKMVQEEVRKAFDNNLQYYAQAVARVR